MLEEMLADYDRTKEAFGLIVKAALAEIQCREELKDRLREAGSHVYRTEWNIAQRSGLDTLFLGWLCAEKPSWLEKPGPIDHYLPRSMMVGVENKDVARCDRERSERIERCMDALRVGWLPEEAIVFAGSKEEWESVCERARIPKPMEGR